MGTFYIQDPQLSYIHIPRTGMGMKKIISSWLKPNFAVTDTDDWMINHPNLKMVRDHIPTGKTISVVRNPWARVWSFYRKISSEGYWLDWNDQTLMDLKPFDAWIEDYANPEIVFECPRWFNRFHCQVDFLNYGNEWVDFILKAEQLENDFKIVQEYLNCDIKLPDLTEFDHNEHWKYFSTQSKKTIAKMFERDLDFLKYTYPK
jgi:hypothetical protein